MKNAAGQQKYQGKVSPTFSSQGSHNFKKTQIAHEKKPFAYKKNPEMLICKKTYECKYMTWNCD